MIFKPTDRFVVTPKKAIKAAFRPLSVSFRFFLEVYPRYNNKKFVLQSNLQYLNQSSHEKNIPPSNNFQVTAKQVHTTIESTKVNYHIFMLFEDFHILQECRSKVRWIWFLLLYWLVGKRYNTQGCRVSEFPPIFHFPIFWFSDFLSVSN